MNRSTNVMIRICLACRKKFVVSNNSHEQILCSMKCHQDWNHGIHFVDVDWKISQLRETIPMFRSIFF